MSKMNIYLSVNNRAEIIHFPVIPSEITVASNQGNLRFDTATKGTLNVPGNLELQSISWRSFFPKKDYSFLRSREMYGTEYVNKIQGWRKKKIPIRLVITDMNINIAVLIDSFNYDVQDGTGDIYYDLQMSEYMFITS
jgi:hypothetical protein